MNIAIASIQRDRNPYILEWVAFHLAVGFNQFYVYCHKTVDGMTETLLRLAGRYPIQVFRLEHADYPQIHAYRHAWSQFGSAIDWMAFIDGDEFLFPTNAPSMEVALAPYADEALSAIGVFWKCYGSNGHLQEPRGLLLENFPRHSAKAFSANRHIKSIVRGGEVVDPDRAHLFRTARGTFDEHLRPVTSGYLADHEPSYDVFRINHYVTQSLQYFREVKQGIGAADLPGGVRRSDDWFSDHDRNEEDDGVSRLLVPVTRAKLRELECHLASG